MFVCFTLQLLLPELLCLQRLCIPLLLELDVLCALTLILLELLLPLQLLLLKLLLLELVFGDFHSQSMLLRKLPFFPLVAFPLLRELRLLRRITTVSGLPACCPPAGTCGVERLLERLSFYTMLRGEQTNAFSMNGTFLINSNTILHLSYMILIKFDLCDLYCLWFDLKCLQGHARVFGAGVLACEQVPASVRACIHACMYVRV